MRGVPLYALVVGPAASWFPARSPADGTGTTTGGGRSSIKQDPATRDTQSRGGGPAPAGAAACGGGVRPGGPPSRPPGRSIIPAAGRFGMRGCAASCPVDPAGARWRRPAHTLARSGNRQAGYPDALHPAGPDRPYVMEFSISSPVAKYPAAPAGPPTVHLVNIG